MNEEQNVDVEQDVFDTSTLGWYVNETYTYCGGFYWSVINFIVQLGMQRSGKEIVINVQPSSKFLFAFVKKTNRGIATSQVK